MQRIIEPFREALSSVFALTQLAKWNKKIAPQALIRVLVWVGSFVPHSRAVDAATLCRKGRLLDMILANFPPLNPIGGIGKKSIR